MLHGRATETTSIDDVLAATHDGRSAALVVRGAPGLGKSALLDYAATQAVGMRVLRATGIESEAELPFAALHLLLRPALTRLHELPPPQANALRGALGLADTPGDDRFLIGLAALSLLAELAGDNGLVCIVDDAHWLDGASADALLFAARRLDAEGIALIFAAREEGFPASGLRELTLDPLTKAASRALLDEHSPGLPAQISDRVLLEADGNPLALRELPSRPTDTPTMAPLPLPGRLQQTYYQQIRNLPPATQTFLLIAAAEDDLTAILKAAGALTIPADAAGPAERAQLITVANLAVTFRHPLIRAAVYQGAVFADRCAVHQALAEALTSPQDADRRAWHQAAAATGPDEKIAAELETTATRARQRRGYAAAAAALERAAMLTPSPTTKADRLIAAAESAADAARPSAATTLATQAAQHADNPVALAKIARVHARMDIERGAMQDAHRRLLTAARLIATTDPTTATIMRMEAGRAASWLGDLALAQEASDELGDQQGPLAPLVNGVRAMAELLAGHPDKAMPALNTVVKEYRSGPRDTRLFASSIAPLSGDFEAAREIGQALAAECRADGTIRLLPLIHTNIALAELQLNKFTDATTTATEGLRLAMDTDQPLRVAYLRCILANLAAITGNEAECRELTAQIRRDLPMDAIRIVTTTTEAALAMIDLGQGHFEAALDRLAAASAGPARYHMNAIYFAADQAEAAFRAGRAGEAEEPATRFTEWAKATGKPWTEAIAHRCQAMLATEDAEPHYKAALAAHSTTGRPFERARTELLYGEWLRRARRTAEARQPLREALGRFTQSNAVRWADRARAELRAAGEAPAAAPDRANHLEALTPQELQVVRLAAAGATNRDIAAQLFLSPRTISHHLYRAFPKLGVTTRTALAHLNLNS